MSSTVLNDVPWLNSGALKAVVTALRVGPETPRIVGGAVRDTLLGLPVSDVDIATVLTPDAVVIALEQAGIKAIPTGIEHGTISAVSEGKTFEITTLRRDVSTDGRRATVAFTSNWQEDAARRDFTINALYADPDTGAVFDYFGGIDDLNAGLVRFIGDAPARIAEDHLRILRFFRFYARFAKSAPDDDAIAACESAAKSLMALSRERIADELMKLLALPDPSGSVQLMVNHKIFAAFLPEISPTAIDRLKRLLERERKYGVAPKSGRRLNAILPDDRSVVELVAARLKLSNKARVELGERQNHLQPHSSTARALAYRHSMDMAADIFLLHGSDEDCAAGLDQLASWAPPVFAIKGGDLVSKGLMVGPAVALTLKAVEQRWIYEGFPDQIRAHAIADQLVADRLSDRKE